MAEPTQSRKRRQSSFLAVPDADAYPVGPLLFNLCMIASSEGLDAALFPSVTNALEKLGILSLNDLGILLIWQLVPQACAAPMWGIVASNAYLTRPQILILGTFFQGLATLLMTLNPTFWTFAILRAVNGVCLASLRPIANSIAGDRFPEEVRGKYFGYIMGSMQSGGAVCGYGAIRVAESETLFLGLDGWKWAFIVVGVFTMALSPMVYLTLKAPPVRPPAQKTGNELDKIKKLFKRWTFTALVVQGMFGLIPWRAMEFRSKYFLVTGLDANASGILTAIGAISAAAGSVLGGFVGDRMAKINEIHGRIAAAEISVYSGIPIAFFSFYVDPPSGATALFVYCGVCVAALGLLGTWTPAACNSPVLCSLSEESERSVVLAWQTGLEGAIGALGGFLFTVISAQLGYDTRCARPIEDRPPELTADICDSRQKLGTAMVICTCVPWGVCGLFYSSLHCSYQKDLDSVQAELAEMEEKLKGAEMS